MSDNTPPRERGIGRVRQLRLGMPEQEAYEDEGDARVVILDAGRATPWRSLNSRLDAPAGLHVTLFQELEPLDDHRQREGQREGFGTSDRDRS